MTRLYHYVGPPEIAAAVGHKSHRTPVKCADDIRQWLASRSATSATATFVIDETGMLWIADQRSEHVACARGRPVLSAGELSFEANADGVDVIYASNQSTGYCPEPQSWDAVARALGAAGIRHPEVFDLRCEFRLCACGQRNIVKNDVFECAVCGSELPLDWNFGPTATT